MNFISKLIFNMMVRLHFLAVIFICSNLFASEDFALGAKHYHAKEYTEAVESFKRAAAKQPTTEVFLNLGLAEYQLAHYGWALAHWRKALDLSPWNGSARAAIDHLGTQNKLRKGTEDSSILERIHQSVIKYIPVHFLFFVTLVLMTLGFWQLFSYLGIKKKALRAGEVVPEFPIKVGVYIAAFILLAGFSGVKYYDAKSIRMTIIAPSAALRAAPTDESASVMELFEGQELVVQRLDKDWVQVTYAGKTTGWIESKAATISSGSGT